MSAEENKAVAHQIREVFNGHEDVNDFDELLVADFVDHLAPPVLQKGLDLGLTRFRGSPEISRNPTTPGLNLT
jgi:hypothetical protein